MKLSRLLLSVLISMAFVGCGGGDPADKAVHAILDLHQDPRPHAQALAEHKASACAAVKRHLPKAKSCDEVIGELLFQWGGFAQAAHFLGAAPVMGDVDLGPNVRLKLTLLGYINEGEVGSGHPVTISLRNRDPLLPSDVASLFRPDTLDAIACLAIAAYRSGDTRSVEIIRDTAVRLLLVLREHQDWRSLEESIENLPIHDLVHVAVIVGVAEKSGVKWPEGRFGAEELWSIIQSRSNLPTHAAEYASAMLREVNRPFGPSQLGRAKDVMP